MWTSRVEPPRPDLAPPGRTRRRLMLRPSQSQCLSQTKQQFATPLVTFSEQSKSHTIVGNGFLNRRGL